MGLISFCGFAGGDESFDRGLTDDCNEYSEVDHARYTAATGGNDDDEANGDQGHEEQDEGRALLVAIGVPGCADSDHGSGDVDGDLGRVCQNRPITSDTRCVDSQSGAAQWKTCIQGP